MSYAGWLAFLQVPIATIPNVLYGNCRYNAHHGLKMLPHGNTGSMVDRVSGRCFSRETVGLTAACFALFFGGARLPTLAVVCGTVHGTLDGTLNGALHGRALFKRVMI
jgi:hypothetical protein